MFKPSPNKNRNAINVSDIDGATAGSKGKLVRNAFQGQMINN